jgi:predicted NAD/FAD-binding protein
MKIAVIGTGISGLTAAHLLYRDHDLTLFEAEDRIGGHTHTVDVRLNGGNYAVDTGFIVFNEKTYPNFIKLMRKLGVGWKNSDMSFSVHREDSGLMYSPKSLKGLFADRNNLFNPDFYRMLRDIFRFRRHALNLLKSGNDGLTLGEYLSCGNYSASFVRNFIIPLGSAIWSADPVQFEKFPARYFAAFFNNHGFLNVFDQPRWLVIRGGSSRYVEALIRPFRDRIRTRCPVTAVRRTSDHVMVTPLGGLGERFDHVILATHSDQALRLLTDPSDDEREILGSIGYKPNDTVLHRDSGLLPPNRRAWASWNCFVPKNPVDGVTITYNMNMLQGLETEHPFCVTLNRHEAIHPKTILKAIQYHHPVYSLKTLTAQKRFRHISGVRRTHFCGAYWGYGFHEDGVNSAIAAVKYFGTRL